MEIFLRGTIIAWLLGWIYANDKRETAYDRETEYVLEQYKRKRKV